MRATFAVNTAGATAADWRTMARLVAWGHEIASHSVTHPHLVGLNAANLRGELEDSKLAIESNIPGYTCSSLVYPYGDYDETVVAAAMAAGYRGARATGNGTGLSFASLPLYEIRALPVTGTGGRILTNNIAQNVQAELDGITYIGGLLVLVIHGFADYSAVDCQSMLDAVRAYMQFHQNVQVMTLGQAIDYVRANGVSVDGGLTWTRALADTSDYRPSPASPVMNSGTNISIY